MKTRQVVLPLIVLSVIIVLLYGASMRQRYNRRGELAERIFSLGNTFDAETREPESIEELRRAISAYEKRIERHIEDAAKNGMYWKILAIRLQDQGLHGEALHALEQAIYFAPEDPVLHYSLGLSAGIMAKSLHALPGTDTSGRQRYYVLAEGAFLRAIELDPRYLRPRYSLGVLYVFELDRPEDAIPHLERCLEISRSDVDTMFVLARAFYMLRDFQAALNLYDRIIILTTDEQKRNDAQNNRQMVMVQMYG